MLIALPLASYRFQYEMLDAMELPPYPGTLWHSVFGNALHQLVCVAKDTECATCMFLHQCDYTHLFQGIRPPGSDIMRKYTTVPSPHLFRMTATATPMLAKGAMLETEVVLPGNSNSKLPTLIRALYSAGLGGLGRHRSRARLLQVTQTNSDGTSKHLLNGGQLTDPMPATLVPIPPTPDTAHLHLLTPYKPSGQSSHEAGFELGRYLMAIIRRIDLMQYFYAGSKLDADFQHLKTLTDSISTLEQTLQRETQQRYSAAMRNTKDASGFTGQLTLDLRGHEALWQFLVVGQWLNVGKNASMGFGRYELAFANQDTMGA